MIDLTGQTALITGGSRGIGRACAILFARAGASVGIGYQSDETSAGEVVDEIQGNGGRAMAMAGKRRTSTEAHPAVDADRKQLDIL